MTEKFQDKVVIVTGASSGIGKEVTLSLLQKGAKVAACSRNEERLESIKNSHAVPEGDILTISCDVSRASEVRSLVNAAVNRFGGIHCLINNAGQYPSTPFLELSEEEWEQVIGTNLKGPFLCSKAVAEVMIAKGVKGQIVNISSTASLIARPGVAHYASSKAGLNMLTKVLALELAPHGIRVNGVLPGLIATEGVQAQLRNDGAMAEHQTKLARIPLGHEGTPRDIANMVLHILSEESSYLTGSLLIVDGGYSLGIPVYQV
jgi:NAD(P)-dependent dehydrogenase (short-subunit alcohol dehydrogenase family)